MVWTCEVLEGKGWAVKKNHINGWSSQTLCKETMGVFSQHHKWINWNPELISSLCEHLHWHGLKLNTSSNKIIPTPTTFSIQLLWFSWIITLCSWLFGFRFYHLAWLTVVFAGIFPPSFWVYSQLSLSHFLQEPLTQKSSKLNSSPHTRGLCSNSPCCSFCSTLLSASVIYSKGNISLLILRFSVVNCFFFYDSPVVDRFLLIYPPWWWLTFKNL